MSTATTPATTQPVSEATEVKVAQTAAAAPVVPPLAPVVVQDKQPEPEPTPATAPHADTIAEVASSSTTTSTTPTKTDDIHPVAQALKKVFTNKKDIPAQTTPKAAAQTAPKENIKPQTSQDKNQDDKHPVVKVVQAVFTPRKKKDAQPEPTPTGTTPESTPAPAPETAPVPQPKGLAKVFSKKPKTTELKATELEATVETAPVVVDPLVVLKADGKLKEVVNKVVSGPEYESKVKDLKLEECGGKIGSSVADSCFGDKKAGTKDSKSVIGDEIIKSVVDEHVKLDTLKPIVTPLLKGMMGPIEQRIEENLQVSLLEAMMKGCCSA